MSDVLKVYEVDVLEERPTTWRVKARNESEAREKALSGKGEDVSGVDYLTGEVVEVRCCDPS